MAVAFGHFELLRLVGQGGLAKVYQAWCLLHKRFVALKVLHPQLAHQGAALRLFGCEAWLTGALCHPHIVKIYEAGQVGEVPYIAMQYCSQGSLADVLQYYSGRLPWSVAVSIVTQIGAALCYAHSRGIIHADVKPGNILFDEAHRALLSDFGIALWARTYAQGPYGTPGYMAPEQERAGPLDQRTDVYGLAAVLAVMLAGEKVLPVSERTIQALSRGASRRLRGILTKALAPDPNRRFSSVVDLVSEVVRGGY